MNRRAALLALGAGAAAALAAAAVTRPLTSAVPGDPLWRRAVIGRPDGRLDHEAVLRLPGVSRRAPLRLELGVRTPAGPRPTLEVAEDGRPPQRQRVAADGRALFVLPPTGEPGLRVRLRPGPGAGPTALASFAVEGDEGSPLLPLVLGALVALAAGVLARRLPGPGAPLGLWLAGLAALAAVPAVLVWALPAPGALGRLVPAVALLVSALVLGARRRGFARGALLLATFVFGAWVRLYFLPSAGGWDADYWKAIAAHAAEHGVTRVYGGPDAVPSGHFWSQLQGREPLFQVEGLGRRFVVDQPPGIQMLWAGSLALVQRTGLLSRAETQNVAAKLPAVVGDVLAVLVLLWCFRREPRRGLALAALYWALPVSWLSSSVLGYFDGAPAPLAVAGLVAAGRGRAVPAGLLLAAAALLKATALIVAPAAALALWQARAPIRRAVGAGLGLVAVVLLPFALDGTLTTAVVHVYRILFQERLSGGFANVWWLASHLLSLGVHGRAASDPIPFVRIDALALPARPIGVALFAAMASWALWLQRRAPGARAAALSAATLLLAYAMLAVGVHENHPHALSLTLLATGVATWRLALPTATLLATAVLNTAALSGLGRFYGLRYLALEPWVTRVEALRLLPGFDLTLALAAVNLAVLVFWLAVLPGEMRRLAGADGPGENGACASD